MTLEVVKYGHPVLRQRGDKIETISDEIKSLIKDMFETMEAYHGVGLAAQQVARPMQLTVIDIRLVEDRPSTLELNGEEADPNSIMPLVLINPELNPEGEPVTGGEGCLSFPEVYAEISRPEFVEVKATNENGEAIQFKCGGLLARCIQHEVDHLKGILFIDRMDRKTKEELQDQLDDLTAETKEELQQAG